MKRAYVALAIVSALAALALAAVARAPRPGEVARVEPAKPRVALRLAVENGRVTPDVSTVRKGWRIHLSVHNLDPAAISFALTGYEELVSVTRIPADSTWLMEFLADRPGDEFEWLVDGHPAGRFIVLGSHLDEGHE